MVADVLDRRRERVTEFGEALAEAPPDPDSLVDKIRSNERVADLLLEGAVSASSTALGAKRRAMGKVVSQGAFDEARIDLMEITMDALMDLDAPHFATLTRIAEGGPGNQDWARSVTGDTPEPVIAALIRHGTVTTVGTYDGGLAVTGISDFGYDLLRYVSEAESDDVR